MPSVAISIRFSRDEHARLSGLARQRGMPVGAYIRQQLATAVQADERGVVVERLERHEKLLKAILLGGVETVDALRAGKPDEAVRNAKAKANERANEILVNLLGRPPSMRKAAAVQERESAESEAS